MPQPTEQVDNPTIPFLDREGMQQTKERKTAGKVDNAYSIQWCQFPPVTVVPFAPALENAASDQLDSAGQTTLYMLHNAANVAEANYQHALDTAQKLSHQLHAAEEELRNSRELGRRIRKGPNAPNNGCTGWAAKSRIDF